tara:strand:- start:940 stop:1569 length:630 start_codon:yes stop_codon:yes gene_type:complete
MMFFNQDSYDQLQVPQEYRDIFNETSLEIQQQKGLTEEQISAIQKRGYFLVKLAQQANVKNIVEVGTAQGYQFYTFGKYFKDLEDTGIVYSCDLRDVRNERMNSLFLKECFYVNGNSEKLSNSISSKTKIDMFFIDGAHQKGDVLSDIENLKHFQSDNCIWVFDDYDERFGIYEELKLLEEKYPNTSVVNQAHKKAKYSNNMLIVWGKM